MIDRIVMLRLPLATVVLSLFQVGFVQCGSYALPYVPATYDYIVIGGGTAGLAIASRLAANSSISVAVVEAGGTYEIDNPASIIPGLAGIQATGSDTTDLNPLIDWDFITTPQPVSKMPHRHEHAKLYFQGLNNRAIHYARGKTLGGTSARNFLVYQRYLLTLLTLV